MPTQSAGAQVLIGERGRHGPIVSPGSHSNSASKTLYARITFSFASLCIKTREFDGSKSSPPFPPLLLSASPRSLVFLTVPALLVSSYSLPQSGYFQRIHSRPLVHDPPSPSFLPRLDHLKWPHTWSSTSSLPTSTTSTVLNRPPSRWTRVRGSTTRITSTTCSSLTRRSTLQAFRVSTRLCFRVNDRNSK